VDELEKICKSAVGTYSRFYSGLRSGLRKTTSRGRCLGRDSKQKHHEYKSRTVPLRQPARYKGATIKSLSKSICPTFLIVQIRGRVDAFGNETWGGQMLNLLSTFVFGKIPLYYAYSTRLTNNISALLSSEQWVSANNMRSTDTVSINIPLCGAASTQSCRSAILASPCLSVHLAVCNNSNIDFREVWNRDETYRHIPVWQKWNSIFGDLTSVMSKFLPPGTSSSLKALKHARPAVPVIPLKGTFSWQMVPLSFKRHNY
jgi:hypothetical protein